MKSRLTRMKMQDPESRGPVFMCIDLDVQFDSAYADEITDTLIDLINNEMGSHYYPNYEESDHYVDGSSLVFFIDSSDVEYFKAAWKVVKKSLP